MDAIIEWLTTVGLKIVVALVVLVASYIIINISCKKLEKIIEKQKKIDKTIAETLIYVIKIILKVVVVVCLVGFLGFETSGISAVIASLGVCLGLAINGTLSNLAGGVMILITRPFKLGDFIKAQGYEGWVQEIRVCFTKIKTYQNKIVYLPNSTLSTGTIENYYEQPIRRVDFEFAITGNDPEPAKKILLEIAEKEALVLFDPKPFARVCSYGLGDAIHIVLRVWCKSEDYWDTYHNVLETVVDEFNKNGIVIPYGQLDVHIK